MFRINRIGHVAIAVPNVEEAVSFYENIIGLQVSERAGGAVFLRCNEDHHCLGLYPGETRALHHLGLEVADEGELEAARSELSRAGIEAVSRIYEEPGHGPALCFPDPDGNRIELFVGMETVDQALPALDTRPVKFGHLTLQVAQMERSRGFFAEALGFRLSDTVQDALAWLRCDRDHHGVALLSADAAKPHHYAYELADWNAIKNMCDHLWQNDVPIIYGPSRHGPGHNLFIYVPDPAGNIIELFSEIDRIQEDEEYEPQDWPNNPKTVDVWRAMAPPPHYLAGEGRPFNNWSAGSSVIGAGWSIVEAGNFVAMDPSADITAPTVQLPEFKVEIPRFTLGAQDPSDHAKAMVYTDTRFPTGSGFSLAAEMSVQAHNTEDNPFGADPDDPRLASGSLALLDDSTGVILNFEVSNRRVMALRELFPVNAPAGDSGAVRAMADPVMTDVVIEPASWHHYEIRYSPGEDQALSPGPDSAEWLVDGRLVHRVEWVATIDPPAAPVVKPARFRAGMAIFTLLDDLPDGRGGTLPGLDPKYEQTLFGQGVTARWRSLQVTC